jgi:N-acetylglucosaminyldiphosphoundecaprenol N-acetyl-beta-D-mannosaminyltransferase
MIAGVEIDNITMDQTLSLIEDLIQKRKVSYIVTPNVDHIIKLQRDLEFQKIYREAACVLPDGMPLLWAGRFLRTPLKEKVSGSDLVPRLCEISAQKRYRLFFLGGRPGAAQGAKERLNERLPYLEVVGVYSPPFGFEKNDEENEKIAKMIKETAPDILLVGLGAPKQEKWIYQHYKKLQIPISMGVGVTFEFIAGMVKRAPHWMQTSALNGFGD